MSMTSQRDDSCSMSSMNPASPLQGPRVRNRVGCQPVREHGLATSVDSPRLEFGTLARGNAAASTPMINSWSSNAVSMLLGMGSSSISAPACAKSPRHVVQVVPRFRVGPFVEIPAQQSDALAAMVFDGRKVIADLLREDTGSDASGPAVTCSKSAASSTDRTSQPTVSRFQLTGTTP